MITIIPKKTTLADRIRSMSDEELNDFLFNFKVNAIGLFIRNGAAGLCDARQQLNILQTGDLKTDLRNNEFAKGLLPWKNSSK